MSNSSDQRLQLEAYKTLRTNYISRMSRAEKHLKTSEERVEHGATMFHHGIFYHGMNIFLMGKALDSLNRSIQSLEEDLAGN